MLKYTDIWPLVPALITILRCWGLQWEKIHPHKVMVTYMCGQDLDVSWFRNWTVWVRHKVNWMGARQCSRSHDRHVHSTTSMARLRSSVSKVRNTCNNSKHHPLLAFGWTTHNGLWMEYLLPLYRAGLGSNVSSVWCVAPCIIAGKASIALYICSLCTSPNSELTISMSTLHKRRGQPHTHTLNTNHGNPSVAQSFWCWEVDQTKAPECNTVNWQLHNVTASLI